MAAIDAKIDELYQLPLAEFTAARNALAKSLTGADAARVKRQEKPTVVPWAINLLYWRARSVYERLTKSGEALRTAQIAALEGKKADVRRATAAHRAALAESVERAVELARTHGSQPGAEPLSRMLEAISLAAEPPAHPGRFTDLMQPAGFEALAGVRPAAPTRERPPTPAPARDESKPERQPPPKERRPSEAEKRAEARRAEAQARRVKAAERALADARAAEAQARTALEHAEKQRRDAEHLLLQLRRGPTPGGSLR